MALSASGSNNGNSPMEYGWQQVRAAKRVVIKIGSNLLTAGGEGLRQSWVNARANEVMRLRQAGKQVIIVTSGAVAAGAPLLGLQRPPASLREKQAAAAAGQPLVMRCYEQAFAAHGVAVGQVLITRADVENRRRYLNARDTLWTLSSLGLVPVVNENDTVMVEEIQFGDNDTLSANVADLVAADLLILLSDVDGFFDADPRHNPLAKPLPLVERVTPALEKLAGGVGSAVGRGGMATKLKAAKMAARRGCQTVLTNGFRPDPVTELFSRPVGTLFLADGNPLSAHKAWIANARWSKGEILVDAGAARALQKGGSLLAKGVVEVRGRFARGDAVLCLDPHGQAIAKGSVNYQASDLQLIRGQHSSAFESILGFAGDAEVIHRDNLVLLEETSAAETTAALS
ncbi:glutamate 5-kinase [Candidatus Magnetaquicoccus inordinatus]|uniref:glutamate 5-kinase n=1 Tax=Candidatus Magnetaquicoccus inordinatus TaxID=2496818 RepID=UPI001D0E6114|nr:glutamate 5-kinase [Candidatus Magnetaquicoccus inordinatus]